MKTNAKTYFLGVILLLAFTQLIFQLLLHHDVGNSLNGLNSIFRNEQIASNPWLISREILDLERSGMIQCPSLVSAKQIYITEKYCSINFLLLDKAHVEKEITASNGLIWKFSGYIPSSHYFRVALWLSRFAVIVGFSLLMLLLKGLADKSELANQITRMKLERAEALDQIARQVSHDIRSPLSALNMVAGTLNELPEDKRLLVRSATQRINDIANGLLQKGNKLPTNGVNAHQRSAPTESIMLVSLLDSIVSEKRTQFRDRMGIDIQGDLNQGYGLFTNLNASEFARAISNLINNSVESFSVSGRVTVSIRGFNNEVSVIVTDNGKGIPPEVLARIGERGFTHGKEGTESGSGLGLYHARATVERERGKFQIQSQLGIGTIITLTLPRAESPKWFVDTVSLAAGQTVVSVDDDQTIHQIWAGRLSSIGAKEADIRHLTFSSLEIFEAWVATHQKETAQFLIDYEFLGHGSNGLDAIERTGIAGRSILVTSRYEESEVRTRAEALGMRLLPKALAPLVPIEVVAPRSWWQLTRG